MSSFLKPCAKANRAHAQAFAMEDRRRHAAVPLFANPEQRVLNTTRPAQAPAMELIGREEALLHEAESAEVADARDAFADLRRQLVSLRAEVPPACLALRPRRRIHGLFGPPHVWGAWTAGLAG